VCVKKEYNHTLRHKEGTTVPNIQSARKRVKVNEKKRIENRSLTSALKTAIKKFNTAIETNQIKEAEKLLPETYSMIDKCASKGVIHQNSAANKKSALATKLHAVKSGKLKIVVKKDNKTIAAEKAKAAQKVREEAKAESKKLSAEKKAEKEKADALKAADPKAKAKEAKTAKKEEKKTAKEAKAKPAEKVVKTKTDKV